MELTACYVHGESLGYGRMGVRIVQQLRELGVDIYDDIAVPGPVEHAEQGRIAKPGHTNVVCWFSTPSHARGWWKGQYPVMLTMFESTQLPPSFRESLHEFPLILVPSHQNVELFSQYHDNVQFLPLGVDPEIWRYQKRTTPDQYFNFLIGGSGTRKGTDLAYKAFRKVFSTWPKDGPVPKLIMKNPRGESFYGDRIEVIPGKISAAAEVNLYTQAHCYLQPSRGEGFGLQPLQAIAQGIPTILTAAHGHDSFAHLGYGLDTTFSDSAYFIFGNAGQWWEPDFNQLCENMEYVYFNWEAAEALAEMNAKIALETFTWRKSAERFVEYLGDEMSKPYSGSGEWYEPTVQRFLVRVNRPWRADVAGINYYFEPDKDYWEVAELKRILWEAELLHPSCLEGPDVGLHPDQIAKMEDYSAAHSYCPLCRQRYGSGVTMADALYAEMAQ